MWATRPHRKELSNCSVQRRQQWASTVGEWSNVWLVSRPVATWVWSRMIQPGLITTRIWRRTSTTSIVAVTTSINHITRHGTVLQCYGGHLHSKNFVQQPDWTTTSNRWKHRDWQWCSNPRQSTMVWNIVSTPSDETTRQSHLEDSYRNEHLGLWVSMDSLPQPTRTTHRDSILRLWCEVTHLISHRADTSRLWDQHEWAINNDKSQVRWKPHHTKGWTSYLTWSYPTTTTTTADHREWWTRSTTRNDSTNTSGHIRSKTTKRQQWHLDDEKPSIHRAHSQAPNKSIFHTIQQWVPHQHRPTWGLQKDHLRQLKGSDHHWGWLSTEGEEGSEQNHRRISMDRRDMV